MVKVKKRLTVGSKVYGKEPSSLSFLVTKLKFSVTPVRCVRASIYIANRERMMVPLRDKEAIVDTKIGTSSSALWFYLSIEFLIGIAISSFITILDIIKSLLPKPPRDLTGDVVLVAGAASTLGVSLAEEFAKGGCSVICVDKVGKRVEEIASTLGSRYPQIEKEQLGTRQRKQDESRGKPKMAAYECDLLNRNDIRDIAKKVKDEVGGIDVLVTCVGTAGQDIFDTASTTLISHYWTILAFLPSMLHRERAHIVGVTPVVSTEDGYMGSRAALASLMESLGHELSNHNNHFTFLAVAPTTESRSLSDGEQQVARDIVEAVRRDQSSLTVSWSSRLLYRTSCIIYNVITAITRWYRT
ncbi:hypothetical protein KPH14_003777 [Odynerus spinipes]|uniref:Uncharacterized protein n=1 Tax=Odynerus spinipes TaxID=1348599 RepID=A0AAD9VUQ0_9HYME|nr:hypothetical protein KPH14_003777 [Odynerus spinipes]